MPWGVFCGFVGALLTFGCIPPHRAIMLACAAIFARNVPIGGARIFDAVDAAEDRRPSSADERLVAWLFPTDAPIERGGVVIGGLVAGMTIGVALFIHDLVEGGGVLIPFDPRGVLWFQCLLVIWGGTVGVGVLAGLLAGTWIRRPLVFAMSYASFLAAMVSVSASIQSRFGVFTHLLFALPFVGIAASLVLVVGVLISRGDGPGWTKDEAHE